MRHGFATLHMLHAHRTGLSEHDQVTDVLVGAEPHPLDAPQPSPSPLRTGRGRYRRRTPQRDAA